MTSIIKMALLSAAIAVTTVSGNKASTSVEISKQEIDQTKENDILGEYLLGVTIDTNEFSKTIDKAVSDYVDDAAKYVNDFVTNPGSNPEDFAYAIEKRSEELADVLENVGESYGKLQGKNGEAFGELFDDDTAKSVTNVVFNIFGKRK